MTFNSPTSGPRQVPIQDPTNPTGRLPFQQPLQTSLYRLLYIRWYIISHHSARTREIDRKTQRGKWTFSLQ